MKFKPLPLSGAYLITLERNNDKRGYFARTFCVKEFQDYGLVTNFVQMSTSLNLKKGQIRGMHYQDFPYQETKIVRCTRGAVYDVILDLRKDSATYNKWCGHELSEDNGEMLYIPKGFAHGYKTLENNTELFYMMDQVYVKDNAREVTPEERYFL